MGTAKEIILKPILSKVASDFIKKHHYSGKVTQNSNLHFGIYLDNALHGAMSFGSPLDKRKVLPLVKDTLWNEMLELNRMAFDDYLPKNSESRALSIAFKLIKKNYPHIKWILSFADGTQCGDGAIYRASGFVLTGIHKSMNLVKYGDNIVIHKMTLEYNPTQKRPELGGKSYYDITNGKYNLVAYKNYVGGEIIPGFQLRYIYFLHPEEKENLTVPILPFGKIDELGAGMYKGNKVSYRERNLCVESSKSEQAISNSKVAENYRPQRSIITHAENKKTCKSK